MIQVVRDRHVVHFTEEQFKEQFGITYLPKIHASEVLMEELRRSYFLDRRAGFFDAQRRWLAAFHAPEIEKGGVANLVIQYTGRKLGYGLFAGRDFRAGEYLGLYTGELKKRSLLRLNVNDYCFRIPSGRSQLCPLMIDAKLAGNELRFVNHSDEPNVETMGIPVGDTVQILYRTTAPLKRGEQLFCDYGLHAWSKRGLTPVP